MSCETEQIRRNWEYGWNEPNQNWVWAVVDPTTITVRMIDAFHRSIRSIDAFLRSLRAHRFSDPDDLIGQVFILVAKSRDGTELTSDELALFKKIMHDWGTDWLIVNEEHIVIDAPTCNRMGMVVN
jgi:hypothetical protein